MSAVSRWAESGPQISWIVLAFAGTLVSSGCAQPRLDLDSDETYRISLREMRAVLKTEREREVLSAALQHLRAWRSTDHQELMEVPALTPAQKEQLKELELQHEVKLYEMLHGKDADGIAETYRKLLISGGEDWTPNLIAKKEAYQQVARIEVSVVDLPDYTQIARGITARSRDVRLALRNDSVRAIERDSFLGIECNCTSGECPEGAKLKFVAIKVERGVEPGEDLEVEAFQAASEKADEELSGVEPKALACSLTSVTLEGKTLLEDSESLYLSDPPEQEIAEVEERIREHEARLQALRDTEFDLTALVAHFDEADRESEELKRSLEGGEASD